MKARKGLVLLILFTATATLAQSATKTPKQVVEEYCKLDAAGALTSSEGWPTISPLFVWPDAPGWDTFTVVRGYTVGTEKKVGKTATVPVQYEVAGVLDSTPRFRPAKVKKVTVVYRLVYDNKRFVMDADGNPDHEEASGAARWRISKPQNEPHVSYEKALAMAQDWLANTPDAGTKKNAERALAELKRVISH